MLICGWDTETDGFKEPIHIVQLGASLVDSETGIEVAYFSLIVRPDGFEIPEEATRVHGITTELATRAGVPLVVAVSALTNLWAVADVRVAHNAEFDERVMTHAFAQLGRPSTLARPPGHCSKKTAAPILRLPPTERMIQYGRGHQHKEPSLAECWRFFFNEELSGAHDALVDARACARVYLECQRRMATLG